MNYKEKIQCRAEEIANEEYGADFYSLPEAEQNKVYARAVEDTQEYYLSLADACEDYYRRKRHGQL